MTDVRWREAEYVRCGLIKVRNLTVPSDEDNRHFNGIEDADDIGCRSGCERVASGHLERRQAVVEHSASGGALGVDRAPLHELPLPYAIPTT